jgi:hypothetical protein
MFEYKVVAVDSATEAEKVMNQYAKEGWRVISNTLWHNFLTKLIITFEREK